jgi:hypothetical protein
MVLEPLPRWAKIGSAVVGLVLAVVLVAWLLDSWVGDDPEPADWRIDPTAELGPTTREVPITVNERSCSSGRSAEGRIAVSVDYEGDTVSLDVGVRPFGGDQDCQGNPDTPYVVVLSEPLGGRTIVGEHWPSP